MQIVPSEPRLRGMDGGSARRRSGGKGTEDQDPRRTVALHDIRGTLSLRRKLSYAGIRRVASRIFSRTRKTVTALVGSSGSEIYNHGLITLSTFQPKGRMLGDGTDLRTVRPDSYRTRLGVVLQESFLFDGTIRENVAFFAPQCKHGRHPAWACRIAPRGTNSPPGIIRRQIRAVVGERGVKFRAGSASGFSIARGHYG